MRIFLAILLATQQVFALTTNNKVAAFNRTEGAVVYENYALNQSFDKNLVGVSTPTGGTASIVTTSGVKLFGKGSLQFAVTSTGQLTAIRSKPFPIGLNGQTCQTKFTYATPYGGAVTQSEFSYFVTNSSGTKISATATLPATFNIAGTQQSKTAVVFYPCPYNSVTPANSWVELTIEHIGSASTSIIIDEKFDMVANDIGAGVPNNVFSAKISSTGVVTDENEDFINGNCTASGTSPNISCNFVSGKFNVAPTCVATVVNVNNRSANLRAQATTSTITLAEWDVSNANAAYDINIVCTRAGTDFIQPAITPNQWNTNLTSAGSITLTSTGTSPSKGAIANDLIRVSLKGDMAVIHGEYKQSSAGVNGTGDYLITLPNGLKFDSNKVSYFTTVVGSNVFNTQISLGSGSISDGSSQGQCVVIPYDSTRFRIGCIHTNGTSTNRGIWGQNYFDLNRTPFTLSFDFTFPVEGRTENQNAPQLVGSVTSDSSNALREEYVTFTCGSGVKASESTPGAFTVGSYSGNGTSSNCPLTFAKAFPSTPTCTVSGGSGAGGNVQITQTPATTTGYIVGCYSSGGNCGSSSISYSVRCTGPR